jgi:hypothetical protein
MLKVVVLPGVLSSETSRDLSVREIFFVYWSGKEKLVVCVKKSGDTEAQP